MRSSANWTRINLQHASSLKFRIIFTYRFVLGAMFLRAGGLPKSYGWRARSCNDNSGECGGGGSQQRWRQRRRRVMPAPSVWRKGGRRPQQRLSLSCPGRLSGSTTLTSYGTSYFCGQSKSSAWIYFFKFACFFLFR